MPVIRIGENAADDYSGFLDTRMTEIDPTVNYGSNIVIASSNFGGGDLQSCVASIALPPELIGATINSATLRFYGDTIVGSPSADVCELLVPFVESEATWNIRSSGNNWNTGGARGSGTDRSATVMLTISSLTTSAYNSYSSAGLAAAVAANAAGGTLDLVVLPTTGSGTAFIWGSSEATDGTRPYLEIDYTPATLIQVVNEGYVYAGGGFTHSIALGAAIQTGNTLLFSLTALSGDDPTFTGDFTGAVLDFTDQNAFGDEVLYYRAPNVTGNPTNLTFTTPSIRFPELGFIEVAGLADAPPSDTDVATSSGNSSSNTVTAPDNALIWQSAFANNTPTWTGDTGYTLVQGSPSFPAFQYDEDAGSAGSKTVTISANAAIGGRSVALVYAPEAAGGTPVPVFRNNLVQQGIQ